MDYTSVQTKIPTKKIFYFLISINPPTFPVVYGYIGISFIKMKIFSMTHCFIVSAVLFTKSLTSVTFMSLNKISLTVAVNYKAYLLKV